MKNSLTAMLVVVAAMSSASVANAADGWGIENEQIVEIEATVVDIACSLTKDCPPNCGDGKRQLGLLTADGKLRVATKGASIFAGAAIELVPYCGKTVFADGLLIENPAMTIFMVQNLRVSKSDKLQPATAFDTEWAKANGKADEWYRSDPAVQKIIEADGVFGIKGLAPKP